MIHSKTMAKSMLQKILKQSDIKPFKIKYYCEKRDPDFEAKKHYMLLVYKQVSMQFDENGNIIIPDDGVMVHTISCDEKPGIQAIATTGDDLRPTAQNGCVMRDAEYKRLGTLSLLAALIPNSVLKRQEVHRCTPDAILLVGEYAPIPPIVDFSSTSYACKQAKNAFPVLHDFKQFIKILFYRFQNFLMLSFHISDDFFINPAIGIGCFC